MKHEIRGSAVSQALPPTPARAMRPLIVLAEDNADFRELLATTLETIGCRVEQARTGTQLLDAVHRLTEAGEPVRLVITDVRMPELGGIDAARALRATGADLPMILMTAFGNAWTQAQAAAVGATLLEKPLRIDVLRQEVRRLLGA